MAKVKRFKRTDRWQLYLMLLPAILLVIIFNYVPMAGSVIAFQDYKTYLGIKHSEWIGLEHFRFLFNYPDSIQVIWNTLVIAGMKIFFMTLVTITFALVLNEVRIVLVKRVVQTIVYLPHFISWVILGGVITELLSPDNGLFNRFLQSAFGIEPIFFLGNNDWFRFTVIVSELWKEFGFYSIIYLASLAGINPTLYEAAEIDGAGRWKQTLHITVPSIVPVIAVVTTLAMSNILNAGFDQIFNLYNPLVYAKGDIIDTFVYRMGFENSNFGFATAVGLFKSVVSLIVIIVCYRIAHRVAGYKIF